VYNGGTANDTVVNDGGTQYLFVNGSDAAAVAGVAVNTTLNGTGAQIIQQGGKASGATLNDSAVQTIHANSSAENVTLNGSAVQVVNADASADSVTINDSAKSWLADGAKITGATQINNSGQLQLSTSVTGGASAESVTLNGGDSTLLIIADDSDAGAATVGELAGDGNVRFYPSSGATADAPVYSKLNVDSLSGNLHFTFNTSIEGGKGDYLAINQGTATIMLPSLTLVQKSRNRISAVWTLLPTPAAAQASTWLRLPEPTSTRLMAARICTRCTTGTKATVKFGI